MSSGLIFLKWAKIFLSLTWEKKEILNWTQQSLLTIDRKIMRVGIFNHLSFYGSIILDKSKT